MPKRPRPPRQPEDPHRSSHLGKYAQIADAHWKVHRPKMYAQLKANGQLRQALLDAQEHASRTCADMIEGGASSDQAWEVAKDSLYLPTEQDRPNL